MTVFRLPSWLARACLGLLAAGGLGAYGLPAQALTNAELCSPRTQGELPVEFINNSSQPVTLHWLDFDCIEGEGAVLPPGQSGSGITYPGHIFRARGQGGQTLTYFVAAADNRIFVVDDPLIAKVAAEGEPYTEGTCSPKTQDRFEVEFVNLLNEPVTLQWIGFNCEVNVLRQIPAKGTTRESTFPGHVFRFVDSVGSQLGSVDVAPDELSYLISAG